MSPITEPLNIITGCKATNKYCYPSYDETDSPIYFLQQRQTYIVTLNHCNFKPVDKVKKSVQIQSRVKNISKNNYAI